MSPLDNNTLHNVIHRCRLLTGIHVMFPAPCHYSIPPFPPPSGSGVFLSCLRFPKKPRRWAQKNTLTGLTNIKYIYNDKLDLDLVLFDSFTPNKITRITLNHSLFPSRWMSCGKHELPQAHTVFTYICTRCVAAIYLLSHIKTVSRSAHRGPTVTLLQRGGGVCRGEREGGGGLGLEGIKQGN